MRVALQAGRPIAGIAFERYPRCGCGFVTYLVVAPQARRCGLGEALLGDAVAQLHGGGAPVVFGEVDDPRHPQHAGDGASGAWSRLTRFQRWGARVAACRYVQPALGPGLARDRALALIVFGRDPVRPRELPGAVVRGFVDELYAATEGGRPDPETAIPDPVALVQLAP